MEPPAASAARKPASRNRPHLKDLNEHIVCPLCRGYLVDATTLVECLHSFCRGCIIRRLSAGGPRACPTCSASVLAPPVPDVGLQRLVYLVVPGLFRSELERRRHFCQVNPQCTSQPPMGAPELCFDDLVSLSLCEVDGPPASSQPSSAKYFKCPAGVTVRHLVRLLMLKMGWDTPNDCGVQCGNNKIEMMYEIGGPNGAKDEVEVLDPSWTLMDLACIFDWKRETPMNILYRIIRVDKPAPTKPATNCYNSNSSGSGTTPTATNPDTSNQAIENIQRPLTPPPSPKPTISRMDQLDKTPRSATVVDQYTSAKEHEASKKPRCEVTPVMRAPDPPPIEDRSRSGKPPKLEHQHKRKKRRNKRVIAEITTTPREDLLKLKVRLTPCPPRDTKDKLMQIRSARKEKLKGSSQKHRTREHKESVQIEEIMEVEKVEEEKKEEKKEEKEEEEKKESGMEEVTEKMEICPVIPPEKETKVVEIEKVPEPVPVEKVEEPKKQPEREESPKNEEVLRRLGLVATSEVAKNRQERVYSPARSGDDKADPALEREKLEKQFRESKANRVRSLLAEKQMRDTLKSIMSNSKESVTSLTTPAPTPMPTPSPQQQQQQQPQLLQQPSTSRRSATPTVNSAKRKEPPPLTPLRSAKRANVTFAPTTFTAGKFESPLDLSRPQNLSKDSISSGMSDVTITRCNPEDVPVSILKNSLSRTAAASAMDKPKDEPRKTQDLNLRTLSDAAVSLIDRTGIDKSKLPASFVNLPGSSIGKSVALKIPQPHQRITGFGMKIKPNIGVRHIPNPQAIVASQYRHQRAGYFHLAAHHHQPP